MTNNERKLVEMAYDGILQIGKDGLIWRVKRKCRGRNEYKSSTPRLFGSEHSEYIKIVTLDEKGTLRYSDAHRLVFLYFYGDIPNGLTVNHKNGKKHDNRLSNLELMTPSQQMIHAIEVLGRRMGNFTYTPRHSKIPYEDTEFVKESKISAKELAKRYKVTPERIYQIRGGK